MMMMMTFYHSQSRSLDFWTPLNFKYHLIDILGVLFVLVDELVVAAVGANDDDGVAVAAKGTDARAASGHFDARKGPLGRKVLGQQLRLREESGLLIALRLLVQRKDVNSPMTRGNTKKIGVLAKVDGVNGSWL